MIARRGPAPGLSWRVARRYERSRLVLKIWACRIGRRATNHLGPITSRDGMCRRHVPRTASPLTVAQSVRISVGLVESRVLAHSTDLHHKLIDVQSPGAVLAEFGATPLSEPGALTLASYGITLSTISPVPIGVALPTQTGRSRAALHGHLLRPAALQQRSR